MMFLVKKSQVLGTASGLDFDSSLESNIGYANFISIRTVSMNARVRPFVYSVQVDYQVKHCSNLQ